MRRVRAVLKNVFVLSYVFFFVLHFLNLEFSNFCAFSLLLIFFFFILECLVIFTLLLTINSISSLPLCLPISPSPFPPSFFLFLCPFPPSPFPYIAGEYFKIKQKNILLSTFTCNSQFSISEPWSVRLDPNVFNIITLCDT